MKHLRDLSIAAASVLITLLLLFAYSSLSQNRAMGGIKSRTYESLVYSGSQESGKIEVMEGQAVIQSRNITADETAILRELKREGGFLEGSNRQEYEQEIWLTLNLRVPKENLTAFLAYLRKNYNVKSWSVNMYRVDVRMTTSLEDIYNRSLTLYDSLLSRVERNDVDSETINAIAQIIEKQAYFQQRLESARLQMARVKEDAEYSRVRVELTQDKPVRLWPEDYWRTFLLSVKDAVREILDTLVSTVTGSVVFAFKVLKFLVYALVVAAILKAAKWLHDKHLN